MFTISRDMMEKVSVNGTILMNQNWKRGGYPFGSYRKYWGKKPNPHVTVSHIERVASFLLNSNPKCASERLSRMSQSSSVS